VRKPWFRGVSHIKLDGFGKIFYADSGLFPGFCLLDSENCGIWYLKPPTMQKSRISMTLPFVMSMPFFHMFAGSDIKSTLREAL
jgi:hypothetical protein